MRPPGCRRLRWSLSSLSALAFAHRVGRSCPGFSIPCGPFSRPERNWSWPGQERARRAGAKGQRAAGARARASWRSGSSGNGRLGRVALAGAALLDVEVELVPGVVRPPRLLGGLDRRPAQDRGPGLRELAGPRLLPSGLIDARCQAGVADQLAGGCEARDVADLAGDRQPEEIADPGDRDQQPDARVGARQRAQLLLEREQALVEHP